MIKKTDIIALICLLLFKNKIGIVLYEYIGRLKDKMISSKY
jgi:hypothetical protein